ncbi:MAG: histone deacetylase family protein, partial [Candidatus Lokiarchaeota archaeon]|nr:histone deacetylase family protein [Candidatus Lokiarchaeota archaeon]
EKDSVKILNPHASTEQAYLEQVRNTFDSLKAESVDIICASAGFDNADGDWGGVLTKQGYIKMGQWMKEYSEKLCEGRRFAILEGGYNYELMAENLHAFCKNMG